MKQFIPTEDQAQTLQAIEAAYWPGEFFLLTGNAGSGKTSLMQLFTANMLRKGKSVVLSAPTHKAVAVLARKMREAGIGVECRTIHSLLSLRAKHHGDRLVFERARHAPPVIEDVVVVDECSMVSKDLLRHIKRHLPNAFVLFVGDPAQIPPVGEVASPTFETKNKAHLSKIVRQAEGNPILQAAGIIRTSQGGPVNWSWCKPMKTDDGLGVFFPGKAAHEWLKKAFTSDDFDQDPDSFRYLAWTNQRVREMNQMIRLWRYGENIPTPFMPGERAMFRSPLIRDGDIVFGTNEEATVIEIGQGRFSFDFPRDQGVESWTATIPSWCITLRNSAGQEFEVHMVHDESAYNRAVARIKEEAADNRYRWKLYHDFTQSLAHLQSIYSMTVHVSQGSTHRSTFVDLSDIRQRERDNLLEMQQLLYTAVTRPTHRVIIV